MQKLDAMIARLRLMLADIGAKESSLESLRHQYREQRNKVIGFAIYSEASIDTSLNFLRDIDDRAQEAERALGLLKLIRSRAASELESLQLTRGVEKAKAELAILQRQQAESLPTIGSQNEKIDDEIRRLQSLINEASERAARNIGGPGS